MEKLEENHEGVIPNAKNRIRKHFFVGMATCQMVLSSWAVWAQKTVNWLWWEETGSFSQRRARGVLRVDYKLVEDWIQGGGARARIVT